MNNIKGIVTNKGKFIEIIMIDEENQPIDFRPLEENEYLVEVGRYNDFVKALYDEEIQDFIESATPEEIEIARPIVIKTITEEEKLQDLLKVIAYNIMNNDELLRVVGIEPNPDKQPTV